MSEKKWTDLTVVLEEMRLISKRFNKYPSTRILTENGYSGLRTAIYRYHKGLNYIRTLLNQELTTKPYGYYKDINNVLTHINEAIIFYGHEPSITELEALFPGIKSGILKYHEGYRKIKDLVGFKQFSADEGYWHNINNVKKGIQKVISETTGYFPSYNEIITYGPRGLYTGIINCYGSLDECRKVLGFPINTKSKLEKKVKRILTSWIESPTYVDNLRSKLKTDYGILLLHPETKNALELDRYYPNERIAIEIQGEQHSKEANLFSDGEDKQLRLEQIKKVDRSKKEQLEQQGILLIEIEYYDSEDTIIEKVRPYFKILTKPRSVEVVKDRHEYYEDVESARDALLQLVEAYPNELFKSDLVKEKNPPLYTALKLYHGGINGARKLINLPIIRETRDSWTFSLTLEKFKALCQLLGACPTKKDVLKHAPKLYYAIVKHGGLRNFNKLYYDY